MAIENNPPTKIGILFYEGFDSLDVAGPNQIFYFLGLLNDQPQGIELYHIGPEKNQPVTSNEGIRWIMDYSYAEMMHQELDVIFVPGGGGPAFDSLVETAPKRKKGASYDGPTGFSALLKNEGNEFRAFYDFLLHQVKLGEKSWKAKKRDRQQLICSVCTGALLLARAGLLDGYACTTHWALKDLLSLFPYVRMEPGFPRYVIDRNRITGGGISSGLDEALAIVEIIRGAEMAQQVQLIIQYAPHPPFDSGDPSVATATTLSRVSEWADNSDFYVALKKILHGR